MTTTLSTGQQISRLPDHIAIIMDGNGRWAQQRGLSRVEGHRAGVKSLRSFIECTVEYNIKYVTTYSFSTENWKRPSDEVDGLLCLFEEIIEEEVAKLHRKGIKLRHLGQLDSLSPHLQQTINNGVELTRNNTIMTFCLAFNYGGRSEILDAVRKILSAGVQTQDINEDLFDRYLYTSGLPDVDLVIRTGGEFRTSNFLIWQAAYSEYYFTETLWPDFDKIEVEKALLAYSRRHRRFGGL